MSAMARLRSGPRRPAGVAVDAALPTGAKPTKPRSNAVSAPPPHKPATRRARVAEVPHTAKPVARAVPRRSRRTAGVPPAPSITSAAAIALDAGKGERKKPNGVVGPQPAAAARNKRKLSAAGGTVTPPVQEQAPAPASFIMSSPKRKPREALHRIDAATRNPTPGAPSPLFKRRRIAPAENGLTDDASDAADDTPSSPQPLRTAQSRLPRSVSDGSGTASPAQEHQPHEPPGSKDDTGTPVNGRARAVNGTDTVCAPSPLKAMLLAPAQSLWRRVSGFIPGSLGLHDEDSDASSSDKAPAEDGGSTPKPVMPGAFASSLSQSVDWAAADTLTAPPMNPTSLGAGVSSTIPASLATDLAGGGGMQLYLSDAHDFGGADSCTASPVTLGYPETPSKENIPVYDSADYSAMDIDYPRTAAAPAITPLMLARPLAHYQPEQELRPRQPVDAGEPLRSGGTDTDVEMSQISSLADSEADAQYDPYAAYEDDEDEFNPYLFMANMPPIPKEHTLRPYALPRKTRSSPPITLVLDLDETLVHCALTKVDNADLVFPVEYNGVNYSVYCRLRPGYREFLEKASELFEVVVFTASQQVYADRLLDLIDPGRRFIRHRLFRDSCVYVNTNYVKDLGILGRDESKLLLVDNCPQAFAYQQSNGIPIESWYEDKGDRELTRLMEFLETLVGVDDVRPRVEARFKTREKIVEADRRYKSRLGLVVRGM